MRRLALTLLREGRLTWLGLQDKRLRAPWDEAYSLKVVRVRGGSPGATGRWRDATKRQWWMRGPQYTERKYRHRIATLAKGCYIEQWLSNEPWECGSSSERWTSFTV